MCKLSKGLLAMTVNAVGKSDNLYTIIQTTAAGSVAGYASKYILPVTKQENSISKSSMLNYCRKITNKAKIADLEALGDKKTLAQDAFIKMANSKDKRAFAFSEIGKQVTKLGGEDSVAGKELRGIIREVNSVSTNLTKQFAKAYRFMLEDIRPAAPFVFAGAGVGFFAGFAHNVFKIDINA